MLLKSANDKPARDIPDDFQESLLIAETDQRRSERVPVRFTEIEYNALVRAAQKHGTTPESFLRALWLNWHHHNWQSLNK